MAKRVGKFSKVSYEQFYEDWKDTFNNSTIILSIDGAYDVDLPKRATKFSAGYDFYSPLYFILKPGETIKIPTGVRCEMNTNYVLMLYVRSSIGFKYHTVLTNGTGIVDADYYNADNEGHIFIKLINEGDKILRVNRGDTICQGIFVEYGITEDDDVQTKRNGGIGSTDQKEED